MQVQTPPKPFRHLSPRPKPTTLIIGYRGADGVALVSDTQITDMEDLTATYRSKVLTPLSNTPFMMGAAGYTDLFTEFNRKIPEAVATRIRQYELNNIVELQKIGLSRSEALARLRGKTKTLEQAQEPPKLERPETEPASTTQIGEIPIPYIYSPENFLDDCKTIFNSITQRDETYEYPLAVLIGLFRDPDKGATLHYIDPRGRESEVETFLPIGSGSPHVKAFFGRFYNAQNTVFQLIPLAIFTIAYARLIGGDNFVGYSEDKPAEAVVVMNNGAYGKVAIGNLRFILEQVTKQIKEFDVQIRSLQFDPIVFSEPRV